MAKIGFIGLGNMGLPMALNLLKAGHQVTGFDLVDAVTGALAKAGGTAATTAAAAVDGAEAIITMLPAGPHVRTVYGESIIGRAPAGTLLIDCSTIDVESARAVAADAERAGLAMVDAPVSGGVGGATAGTLTFMVGGPASAFERAQPILAAMGRTIVHAGGPGNGQAAKICNNMILGITMVAVCEAYAMGEKLGVDAQTLFDITSKSSGSCWAITNYLPVPGPVPTSPANRDYQAGFTAAMMLKDMALSQDASKSAGAATPIGAHAERIYRDFVEAGNGQLDFSGIMRMIRKG